MSREEAAASISASPLAVHFNWLHAQKPTPASSRKPCKRHARGPPHLPVNPTIIRRTRRSGSGCAAALASLLFGYQCNLCMSGKGREKAREATPRGAAVSTGSPLPRNELPVAHEQIPPPVSRIFSLRRETRTSSRPASFKNAALR